MSLKSSFKIPKNGLFFFEIDNLTCVLATKKICKVLESDNKSKGSRVLVTYGEEELEATIIGVSVTKHTAADVKFLTIFTACRARY